MPPLPSALLLKRNPTKQASESHLQRGIQNPTKSRGAAGTQRNPGNAERLCFDMANIAHAVKYITCYYIHTDIYT